MAPLPPPPPPPAESTLTVALSLLLCLVAYAVTARLVPLLADDLVDKGLKGRDMLKPGFHSPHPTPERDDDDPVPGRAYLPEATGVIGASVYILLLSLFAPLPYLASLLPSTTLHSPAPSPASAILSAFALNSSSSSSSSIEAATPPSDHPCAEFVLEGSLAFPHHSLATYLASLLSLLIATFLGFCDDVFDIRWRFKLPIPVIASVPLLVTYAAGHGVTDIVLPRVLGIRDLFGAVATNGVLHL
ncbi:hypothetical protein JCM10212_003859, partial [Sporobolomyces blumeae]